MTTKQLQRQSDRVGALGHSGHTPLILILSLVLSFPSEVNKRFRSPGSRPLRESTAHSPAWRLNRRRGGFSPNRDSTSLKRFYFRSFGPGNPGLLAFKKPRLAYCRTPFPEP